MYSISTNVISIRPRYKIAHRLSILQSLLLTLGLDLDNLIYAPVFWHIDIILIRHLLAQKSTAHEVASFEPLHQRLRSCQADQCIWIVLAARARIRWTTVNVPGRR